MGCGCKKNKTTNVDMNKVLENTKRVSNAVKTNVEKYYDSGDNKDKK